MKKIFYFLAIGTMMAVACNKETIEPASPATQKVTISASSEVTKADLTSSNQIVWALNDEIAVRLYKGTAITGTDTGSGFEAKDSRWVLDAADAGKAQGNFTYNGALGALDQWHHWGYAAFYPVFDSNTGGDGKIYIHYQDYYENYESGRLLMPVVANMNYSPDGLEGRPTDISFKHVGAGVKVTLKDIPAAANQVSLTVPGKNIKGWYNIDPANAGASAAVPNNATLDDALSTVYIKFATASSKRTMTFVFPVPVTELPDGTNIKLYYGDYPNDVVFWTKTGKNLPELKRGELYDMGEITVDKDPDANVTLYFGLTLTDETGLKFCSEALGTAAWPGSDIDMTDYEVIAGKKYFKYTLKASDVWGKKPSVLFYATTVSGAWDTYSQPLTADFTKAKKAYYFDVVKGTSFTQLAGRPKEPTISIDGTFSDWSSLEGTEVSGSKNKTIMKAYSDGTLLFIYLKVTPVDPYTIDLAQDNWCRFYFDKDNKESTGSSNWYNTGADDVDDSANDYRIKFGTTPGFRGFMQGNESTYGAELEVVSSASGIELELQFKVEALNHVTTTTLGDEINVFCLGYSPQELTGKKKGVIIPAVVTP